MVLSNALIAMQPRLLQRP